jgi:hypothetical protein
MTATALYLFFAAVISGVIIFIKVAWRREDFLKSEIDRKNLALFENKELLEIYEELTGLRLTSSHWDELTWQRFMYVTVLSKNETVRLRDCPRDALMTQLRLLQ